MNFYSEQKTDVIQEETSTFFTINCDFQVYENGISNYENKNIKLALGNVVLQLIKLIKNRTTQGGLRSMRTDIFKAFLS